MDNNEAMTIEYEGRSYLVGISNSGKVRFVAVENPTGRAVGGKLRCKLSSVIMTEFWASFGFDR